MKNNDNNLANKMAKKKLSAVIACYGDDQAIPIMHERLTKVFQSIGCDYEIIFVNDGSPGEDEAAIQKLTDMDHHTIGISHSRNFGSQSAFLSGMEVATGDAVILLDGDLQDPPEVIPELVAKWEEGYGVVYGQRVKREGPFYMKCFYKFFYHLYRWLSEIPIPLDAGDFSLIDKKAVDHLLRLSEKDVFLRGLRAWIGFKQVGVPYVRRKRVFGRTTNSFLKNIWWAKKGIFSLSMKPLHIIQGIGVCMFLITIALAIYYLIAYFIYPQQAKGITTVILLVLGIGSIQIISLSIIGDYIGKITEEVKNRPRFIRKRILWGGKSYESREQLREFFDRIDKDPSRCHKERI